MAASKHTRRSKGPLPSTLIEGGSANSKSGLCVKSLGISTWLPVEIQHKATAEPLLIPAPHQAALQHPGKLLDIGGNR